jgi:serine/threonine protein kinase
MPIPRPSRANPHVIPALDDIVMRALERDPARRWQSAAEMQKSIDAVMAQPGNWIDPKGVSEWVTWAFSEKRGRNPQFTPHMPMGIATFIPDDAVTDVSVPIQVFTWSRENIMWVAGAVALALFILLWPILA